MGKFDPLCESGANGESILALSPFSLANSDGLFPLMLRPREARLWLYPDSITAPE